MSEIMLSCFDDLLLASRQQPQPQRLLFVFTRAELPEAATAPQRQAVEAGCGGNLAPTMCVDKAPTDITNFAALVDESAHTGQHWDLVFVSSLGGKAGIAPSEDEAVQPLQLMVTAIREGRIAELATFNRQGDVVAFY